MTFWAAPTMTYSHFMFSIGASLYILVAIPFEERNLVGYLGKDYIDYKARVSMIIPGPRKNPSSSSGDG